MKLIDAVRIIIHATYSQTLNCIKYNLHCLDPPSVVSGMLDHYGLDNYTKKLSFWKAVDTIVSKYNGVVIFKSRFGLFKLVINHSIEEVYRVENSDIYLDILDCSYMKCVATPRSHTLRIYLEGEYSKRVILRMNIITLLKIAIYENPYFRECLEEFVADPLSPKAMLKIANCAMDVVARHRNIYGLLFSRHAKDAVEALRYSPLLKKYLDVLKNLQKQNTNTQSSI